MEEIGLSIWFLSIPDFLRFELKGQKQYLSNHDLIVMICSVDIWCIKEGDSFTESFLYNQTSIFMGKWRIVEPRKSCTSKAQSRNLQR